jgi:hypothetical protein
MPLDPEIAARLEQMPPMPAAGSVPTARLRLGVNQATAAAPKLDVPLESITDSFIDGPDGRLPVRIYTPKGAAPFPLLVYVHGGGYVTAPIERIVADGVLTEDGQHHPVNVLVLAAGFAMTKMLRQIEFVGRGGKTLHETWGEEDPRSYLGTLVPGFPDLFMIGGPNGGATHGAGVNIYSEAQVNYILSCLDTLREKGAKTIEPTRTAHDIYNEQVDRVLEGMVWSHRNVTTYYRNSKGRNFISCSWRIVDFWRLMRAPKLEDMTIG